MEALGTPTNGELARFPSGVRGFDAKKAERWVFVERLDGRPNSEAGLAPMGLAMSRTLGRITGASEEGS